VTLGSKSTRLSGLSALALLTAPAVHAGTRHAEGLSMSSTIRIILMATLFAALVTPAAAVQIDWVGPTGNYSDITKWSKPIPAGPCNSMFIGYEVNVPVGGKVVTQDVASCTTNTFTLGDGSTLILPPGIDFKVTGQASLAGIVDGNGGNFTILGPATFAGTVDGAGGNFTIMGPATFTEGSKLTLSPGTNFTVTGQASLAGIVDGKGGNFATLGPVIFAGERARAYAAAGSQVLIGAPAYSSKGLVFADGYGGSPLFTTELFKVMNPGSLLDLSSIQSIDAGFPRQTYDSNHHEILCSDSATLDLSGVRTITSPVGSGDWLRFTADSGCTIKLNSLQKITSAGAGPVKFAISGGGKIETMAPVTVAAITDFTVGTDSSLRFGGGELGGNGSKIDLQSATASLVIEDDLILEEKSLFLLAPGSVAELKGSLFFKQLGKTPADRAQVKMSEATVKLTGSFPKVQILEAAGADVLPQLPGDDNFGIGKLVLAGDEQGNPSLAAVVDRFNNGQRDPSQTCSSTEVLYLFGLSDGHGGRSDGLVLENGSTLFLDDAVKVYAWSEEARLAGGNPVVLLNEILGSETSVPYSGGFLAHDLSDRDGDGISDLADNCPDTPNGADLGALRQADADCNAKGDACECGDFNKDGTVNTIDARAIQKWVVAPGPVPPMFCDTNGDGRCNTIDARRIQRKVVGELDPDELLCRPYYPCPRFGGTCLP